MQIVIYKRYAIQMNFFTLWERARAGVMVVQLYVIRKEEQYLREASWNTCN